MASLVLSSIRYVIFHSECVGKNGLPFNLSMLIAAYMLFTLGLVAVISIEDVR